MKIEIKTSANRYNVHVENEILKNVGEIVKNLCADKSKVLIVSETNVFPLYGQQVEKSLKSAGLKTFSFIFQAGEASKQIQTVYKIYEALTENNFTRSDIILTLGGGVAGDMGGFAAATFLRGIGFVQVPTSLLAQVDASVGGKTGVDLPCGKNLVGAFHQPLAVISDPKTLKTLSDYYFNDGMGEIIKYGCIADSALFSTLKNGLNVDYMTEIILRCVEIKKEVVEEDTLDTGRRMVLNFGHTFGHAIEKLYNFSGIAHGEAVGIGMVIAAKIGESLELTEPGTSQKIIDILESYKLPTTCKFSMNEMIDATALDKKSMGEDINIILIKNIGKSFIYKTTRDKIKKLCKGW